MEQQMNSEGHENRSEGSFLPEQQDSVTGFPDEIKNRGIKSINLLGSQLVITAELSGVFCQGVQYYDLKNILFINNAGMANLIDLLKSLLRQGVQVQFVNVNEKIKQKIKEMGLEHVLICS
jgi:ABC-type transporter Mla MlaB component